MIKNLFAFSLWWVVFTVLCSGSPLPIEDAPHGESPRLRRFQHNEPSTYQGQAYPSGKIFRTKDFFSQQATSAQQLPNDSYPTRSFFGIQNSFLGKKVFMTTTASAFSNKESGFEKKIFSAQTVATKDCQLLKKRYEEVLAKRFPVEEMRLDPKAQKALDQDQILQQARKKAWSSDTVRGLLNQGI